MKTKALIVLVTGLMAMAVSAQEFKCGENFKWLEESVKAKDYDKAASLLESTREKCPKYDVKLYTLGETVLQYYIDTYHSEGDTKIYTASMLLLYDQWEKNFPGTGGVQKKVLFLHATGAIKDDEAFKLLDASFASHKNSFTHYSVLELYFNLYLARYAAGDKGITQEQFIQKFSDIAGQVALAKSQAEEKRATLLKKQETQLLEDDEKQFVADAPLNISALEAVADNMVKQSSKYFTCEKLEAYYGGLYEANKENSAWLMGMVTVLSTSKCTASPTLYNGALELYKQKPSPSLATVIGNLLIKKNNSKEAAAYFEKSVEFEADSVKKAEVYMTISNTLRNSDRAQAKAYVLKAAAYNPKSGKPYLQLAEMYASVSPKDCQLADFDKKALYWLAISTAKKAEAIDPKTKPSVSALVKRYEAKAPTKADAKAAKKSKGDTVTYGCWINETVTVPKL